MDQARNDLSKGGMIFSKESCRAVYEVGNMELIELRQTSATVQCPSCLIHVPEGLNMCLCGVWLRPNQDTMNRIKARFDSLTTPYYRATLQSRGQNARTQSMAKRPCKSRKRKTRSKETQQPSLDTQQMAQRREIPSFTGGGRVD